MPGLPLPFPTDSTPNQTSSFPSLSRPQATASQLFLPAPLTPLTTSAINCFVNLQTRTRTLSTHLLHSYLSFGLDQRKIIKLWPESLWKFMVYHLSSTLIPKTHKSYSTILSLLLDWPPPHHQNCLLLHKFLLSDVSSTPTPPTITSPSPCTCVSNPTFSSEKLLSLLPKGSQEHFLIHYFFILIHYSGPTNLTSTPLAPLKFLLLVTNDLITKSNSQFSVS